MKAYLLEEFGAELAEREVDDPEPTGKEVLVRVLSSGLCHSDLHFQDGFLDLGGGHSLRRLGHRSRPAGRVRARGLRPDRGLRAGFRVRAPAIATGP